MALPDTLELERAFMAAVDSNPEFRDAVRSRLLTRDLMDLPDFIRRYTENTDRRIAALDATVQRFVESTERRLGSLEAGQARLEEGQAEANRRLDKLEDGQAEANRRLDKLEDGQARLEEGQARLEEGQKVIRDDMGIIKGFHAREVFAKSGMFQVQRRMRLRIKEILSQKEISDILWDADTTGIPDEHLESFDNADAIVLVTDPEAGDAECYVAIEVSFTVHTGDVERADRHAEFLTRWTGIPARSAVAGVNLHEAARKMSKETGTVFLRVRSNTLRER